MKRLLLLAVLLASCTTIDRRYVDFSSTPSKMVELVSVRPDPLLFWQVERAWMVNYGNGIYAFYPLDPSQSNFISNLTSQVQPMWPVK